MTSGDERRERTLEMTAGVVGPKSLASDAQRWWHGELGIRAPRGLAVPAAMTSPA